MAVQSVDTPSPAMPNKARPDVVRPNVFRRYPQFTTSPVILCCRSSLSTPSTSVAAIAPESALPSANPPTKKRRLKRRVVSAEAGTTTASAAGAGARGSGNAASIRARSTVGAFSFRSAAAIAGSG